MSHIEKIREINAVVHFGAGAFPPVEAYFAAGANRIILVEANPYFVASLRERFAHDAKIEIVDAAISNKESDELFRIFNLSSASSLREPTGLGEIYKSLRVEKEFSVRTTPADGFTRRLKLSPEDKNLLVLDTPGEEFPILKNLAGADLLTLFSDIIVHGQERPLYKGAAAIVSIKRYLEENGFAASIDNADADWPVLICATSPIHKEKAELTAKLSALQEQLAAEQEKHRTEKTELEEKLSNARLRTELFQSEIDNADAQIALIKEMLIRDNAS